MLEIVSVLALRSTDHKFTSNVLNSRCKRLVLAQLIFAEPLEDSIFMKTKGDNPKLYVASIFFSSIRGRRHLGRVVAEVAGIGRQEIMEVQQIMQRLHERIEV